MLKTQVVESHWVVPEVQVDVKERILLTPKLGVPGDEVICSLARSKGWSVVEFENDGRWTFYYINFTTIPKEALFRKRLIEEAGVEVDWIIAHEIPMEPLKMPKIEIDGMTLLKGVLIGFGIFALICMGPLAVFALALSCSTGDPCLIARVKNRRGEIVWMDVCRWYS